ncbi:hypothetical protein ACQRIU_006920 [Beauveria bassiana]
MTDGPAVWSDDNGQTIEISCDPWSNPADSC